MRRRRAKFRICRGSRWHVVDTIGSGDAHAGGVLAGLASGFTLAEAVLLGNAVASWVTAQEGAATAPQAAELRARHLLDI